MTRKHSKAKVINGYKKYSYGIDKPALESAKENLLFNERRLLIVNRQRKRIFTHTIDRSQIDLKAINRMQAGDAAAMKAFLRKRKSQVLKLASAKSKRQ